VGGESVVHGTEFADTITIGSGHAFGFGGNDNINTFGSAAKVFGGDGDDAVHCYSSIGLATCTLEGEGGNDWLVLDGAGAVRGGPGDDVLSPGSVTATNRVNCGVGVDRVNISTSAPFGTVAQERVTVTPVDDQTRTLKVVRGDGTATVDGCETAGITLGRRTTTLTMSAKVAYSIGEPTGSVSFTIRVPGGVWTSTSAAFLEDLHAWLRREVDPESTGQESIIHLLAALARRTASPLDRTATSAALGYASKTTFGTSPRPAGCLVRCRVVPAT
jgi:hypothetical protein